MSYDTVNLIISEMLSYSESHTIVTLNLMNESLKSTKISAIAPSNYSINQTF